MYNNEPKVDLFSYEDNILLNMFENVMNRYNQTIIDSTGHAFNQSILVNTIVSYINSKYVNTNKNNTRHFFNQMRKLESDYVRKTHIKFSKLLVNINDPSVNYLLNAAKVEFEDDTDAEQFSLDFSKSIGRFGTAVTKLVHKGKGKNTIKSVPFESFICDPENGESNVHGEVSSMTMFDLQQVGKYDQPKVEKIINHLIGDGKQGYDPHKINVRLYEMHGKLPASVFTKNASGYETGMFVLAETEDGSRFVIYKGRTDYNPFSIEVIEKVQGRTMGYGPMEAVIEYQIMINKLGNLAMDQVEASKIFYQTSDAENDGYSLSELDNLTLLYHAPEAPVTQVSATPQGYGAIQSFFSSITSMSYEAASIQDASLGRGVKSNTSFAALTANAKEADGVYTHIQDKLIYMYRRLFKKDGGFLSMMLDYIESGKAIEELLTPYEARGFRKHIAEKLANLEGIRQKADPEIEFEDNYSEIVEFILKRDKGKEYSIEIKDGDIDRKYVIDKTRITYGDKSDVVNKKIEVLEMIMARVERQPDLYPSFNPDQILGELASTTDLAVYQNSKQSQTSVEPPVQPPTGPQVASESGLV